MTDTLPVIAADAAAPLVHRFRSGAGEHVLVVPYSRIFDIAGDGGAEGDFTELDLEAALLAEPTGGEVRLDAIAEPAPQSISLNVSSSCNLTCGYCYAARGSFGGAQPAPMEWSTAQAAIDRLLADADPSAPITIGFLGGEPFVNRRLIHRAVAYAASKGALRGLDIRFSVTTNGTLIEPADIALLRDHAFAVTVSLDGAAEIQDRQRPRHGGGGGSWQEAVDRVAPLLALPGQAKIAARATVTRGNLDIAKALEALAALGYPEVGFAPLRVGPAGSGALRDADWPDYLAALIAASRMELERLGQGLPIRLTNLAVALKQLHRGATSPYPCGAGGGYFSVSAAGRWYACHRAIGKSSYELGSNAGIDPVRRREFVRRGHVHAQTECRSCWARYLCSGGCHQEASARSTASCDFIRGWLSFCLAAYCELGGPPQAVPASLAPAAEEVRP
jgi:uncharacterized protein